MASSASRTCFSSMRMRWRWPSSSVLVSVSCASNSCSRFWRRSSAARVLASLRSALAACWAALASESCSCCSRAETRWRCTSSSVPVAARCSWNSRSACSRRSSAHCAPDLLACASAKCSAALLSAASRRCSMAMARRRWTSSCAMAAASCSSRSRSLCSRASSSAASASTLATAAVCRAEPVRRPVLLLRKSCMNSKGFSGRSLITR
mmetsp:Transcript_33596/g.106640  ORF Transcript_33596/g.106640 Transcript_33596/m.106640 type:complete len:208 (-) Transcript_33596:685-1308(-)